MPLGNQRQELQKSVVGQQVILLARERPSFQHQEIETLVL